MLLGEKTELLIFNRLANSVIYSASLIDIFLNRSGCNPLAHENDFLNPILILTDSSILFGL